MLDDVDFWTGERVDRGVVAVGVASERQNTTVIRVSGARHTSCYQAQQHPPGSICRWISAERSCRYILSIAGKVRSKAPNRLPLRPGRQWLEALQRAAHDAVQGRRAVEEPSSVHAGDEFDAHAATGLLHRFIVSLHASILLHRVLHALDSDNTHAIPPALVHSAIRRGILCRRAEDCRDQSCLQAIGRYIEQELLRLVGSLLSLRRDPKLPQLREGEAQISFGLLSLRT
mmetsp:Transcript_82086/g.171831  ORF Transcript_82086/g.171831 Transcript_82086/m.171831 type:complete len:230 (-) Transcript_82086:1896-2585(-)